MKKVTFVIGANATGKTYFIKHHFAGANVVILNIYDYQQKAYHEAGYKDTIPFSEQFRCLKQANDMHLHDIIEELKQGRDVVAEQTFFKAKRRIAYIEEIRKIPDVTIEVFVMQPDDEQWGKNIKMRGLDMSLQGLKEEAGQMKFPNPAEGFDAVYEVIGGEINLHMDEPNPEIVIQSKQELAEETARLYKADEEKRRHLELLKSMETRPFWHYCEVCGKKEYITAQQAFDTGWDYPPHMGSFRILGPRNCGKCLMKDTLYWKVTTQNKIFLPIVVDEMLTPEESTTWRRIQAEPESLLKEEMEDTKQK